MISSSVPRLTSPSKPNKPPNNRKISADFRAKSTNLAELHPKTCIYQKKEVILQAKLYDMKRFAVSNFGPINDVNISFGDLTILVGPQASGKSISLELLKLAKDRDYIIHTLDKYNYIWGHNTENILNVYFGEGLSKLWKTESMVSLDNVDFTLSQLPKKASEKDEEVFYIPAQRILAMSEGRPRNFMEFDNSAPYVLRSFSETLRLFVQNGMGQANVVFPMKNRLKGFLRSSFNQSIFHDGKIVMEERGGQKKLLLNVDDMSVPFMAWSAGQKEFMPLLLAFYCLSGPPSKVVKREKYKTVIIEEPEMGLHPKAIISIILQVLELMQSGYQVVLSTHSSVLLEFAWAFNILKNINPRVQYKALNELFGVKEDSSVSAMLAGVFDKSIRTYYFNREIAKGKVNSFDISTLDAGASNSDIADWGGISGFATHVSDVIARYI